MSSDHQHPTTSLQLDVLRDEVQNLKDEIQFEKRKQANVQQRTTTMLRDHHIALTTTQPNQQKQELQQKMDHYTKVQELLSLQVNYIETSLANATSTHDNDQDLSTLLATLKQDLADADEQLEALHHRTDRPQ